MSRVYAASSMKLFGLILRVVGDRSDSEDVLQDVYVKVWRRSGSYDPALGAPLAWLSVIARNGAIDRARLRSRLPRAAPNADALDAPDPAPSAYEALEADEAANRLHRCIGALDEPTALAIRTAFIDGLSYPELAARLKAPLSTIKSRIRRGLLQLRETMAEQA